MQFDGVAHAAGVDHRPACGRFCTVRSVVVQRIAEALGCRVGQEQDGCIAVHPAPEIGQVVPLDKRRIHGHFAVVGVDGGERRQFGQLCGIVG